MYRTWSASLETVLPTTLVRATIVAPICLQFLRAAKVSAVSPDWLTTITKDLSVTSGFLYLNSDAISTSTGILANDSIKFFPTRPA